MKSGIALINEKGSSKWISPAENNMKTSSKILIIELDTIFSYNRTC